MDLSSLFKEKNATLTSNTPHMQGPVVTRIAPSPTGPLHIGTARSALFNYLFARHNKGKFIVRIEDTDKKRSKKEFETDILEGLNWLGLTADEIYRQSERRAVYTSYIDRLLKSDSAYISKEESKTTPGEQVEVIRLRNQNKKVVFQDLLRGSIEFDTTELGDFVIARSMEEPLYHLAVVIDDYEMKITHIIRGEDHISNTPRQILIQEELALPRPQYVHIPLILSRDRSKISKRASDGQQTTSIQEYREKGYIPEAMINYLALLGWNSGTDQELFSIEHLIKIFDITKIQKGGAIFDEEKLNWFNHKYLKMRVSENSFRRGIESKLPSRITQMKGYNKKILERLIPVLQDKIQVISEVQEMANSGELDYYFNKPSYNAKNLLWKDESDPARTQEHLHNVGAILEQLPAGSFKVTSIKKTVWDYAEEKGRGAVLWPMRYALSGKDKSPDPFTLAYIIGKKETLERLAEAINKLSNI